MSEQALRDALAELVDMLDRAGQVGVDEWLEGERRAKEALAEAGEPEMVTLLRWLERRCGELRRGQHGYRSAMNWNTQIELGCKARMAEEAIAYIAEQFGYKLEDYSD